MQRTLLALCTLALAAAPVAAGPIYLPVALHEADGAYVRATELRVTNPDTLVQGFVVRYIQSAMNGTVRTAGDEAGPYYLAPGESKRYTDLVPNGFHGMLELDGAAMLQFNGALTVRNSDGTKVGEAEVPVLTQANLALAGTSLMLQGWERAGSTLTTNFGIVNPAHVSSHCRVTIRQRDGLLVIQDVPINPAPLTMVHFEDALAILGLTSVPEGARSVVSCDHNFWTYISKYNDQTGEVEFIEPSTAIASSTLTKPGNDPGPDPPPGNAVVFTRDGEIVRYPAGNTGLHNFQVPMPFGGNRQFRKVTVDFDFHIGSWDPHNPTGFHCIFYLQNGSAWNNMFGYVNTRGTRGLTVFQVNATGHGREETATPGSPQPGGDYHMRYEYDLPAHVVFFRITNAAGTVVTRSYNLVGTTFSTNSFFIQFGYQLAEGPESYTPGWAFSNLRAVFIP